MYSVLLRLKVAVQRGSMFGPVWYSELTLSAVSALVVLVGSGDRRRAAFTETDMPDLKDIFYILRGAESVSG